MSAKQIIQYGLVGGILSVLLIPFIVADSQLFPFITGKAFVFRIVTEILFALWIVGMFYDSSLRLRFSWILGTVAIFVGVTIIADVFGVDFYRSFWSNFERMEGLITTLHLLAYFIVAGSVLNTKRHWTAFFKVSIFNSVLMSLYVFLQLAGKAVINQGGVRVDGLFGNATYLAVYMLFNFFITLFLFARSREENQIQPNYYLYTWYSVALVFQVVVIYYTATRGAILGLIGGLILTAIAISIFEKNRATLRKISVATMIAVVLFVGGFVAIRKTDFVAQSPTLSRFATLSLEEVSKQGRRYVWPMALEGFKDRPILGWGQGNFSYVFAKHYDPRMYNQEPWFDHAHNIVLDMMVSGGVLGLTAYLSIFVAFLVLLYKNQTLSVTDKSIIFGLSAAYFFQNLFVFDNLVSSIYFFAILAFIHSENVRNRPEPAWISRVAGYTYATQKVLPAVVIVLLVFGVYALNVKPILASRSIIKALSVSPQEVDLGVKHFEDVFEYGTFADGEATEQMANRLPMFTGSNVGDETRQKYLVLAQQKLEDQVNKHPNDARALLFAGSFRNRIGDHASALKYIERAVAISPKKQIILFEMGFAYLSLGEHQKAFDYFKTAHDLAPGYQDAKILLAISALYNKNYSFAKEVLAGVDENTLYQDERILSAYVNTGHAMDAVRHIEKRAELNPTDPQILFRLSAGYLMVEQRGKSIEVLRRIVKDFPQHKDQAEYYIKEIQAGRNP